MEVNTTINTVNLDVELSGPTNPITIDAVEHFPVNQVCNIVVENISLDGDVLDLDDYTIVIAITDPDDEVFTNGTTLTKLGNYVVTITLTENSTQLEYGIITSFECVNSIIIETTDCAEFTVNNYNLFAVNVQVLNAFTDEEIAPVQEIASESAIVFDFEEILFYKVVVTYDETTEIYLANTYCKLNECIAKFIAATLCDSGDCLECPESIDLNRVLGLHYTLNAKVNDIYGKNNFYTAMDDVPALNDVENVLNKLKTYCDRIGCIETTNSNTKTSNTSGCGCSQ